MPEPSADELCALLYTSGSTGVPKAVMQSHRSMDAAAAAIVAYLENEPSDVVLDALPLSFDYGLYNALMPLRFGGRCVLEPRGFTDIAGWLRLVEREQVTGVPVVPPVAALVAGLGGRIGRTYPSVRYVTSTGQALQPAHGRALQRLFPNARLYSMYGLTECKRATFLPPEEYARRPTSVGVAMPGVRLRLVDAAGAEIRGPFERGELLVEGENVMLGYWRRDAETAAVLAPGATPGTRVLRTGDLFERDAEGYYFFVARRDGLVKVGGQRVSPREVEDVLAEVEGVAAAAAFGVEHPILGTAIEAAVVPAQGHELDAGALLEHCRVHLEPAAVPRRIDLVAELPRTENGKTDYARLREAVGGRA